MVDLGRTQKASGDLSFSAVVGQEQLKEALLAVTANDGLDGLLIRGEKGTAKSTTVRALRDLLGTQRIVADCPYGCPPDEPAMQCPDCRERTDPPTDRRQVPLVTLPLGATRERVVGTLSVADALAGDYEFDPGLLARANRGILYVDEVNLLDDHLVDVLLDVAAGGTNRVERDSVSVTHPAEFTLVGTMNPEEGDLRPQLRDRFALQATVTGCEDIDDRVRIVDRALGATELTADAPPDDEVVRTRLRDSRARLSSVTITREQVADVAELCREAGVDGHRGDIATARAARTLAALDGRETVVRRDLRRGAQLALPHRLQSRPFEDSPDADDLLEDHFDDHSDESEDGERDESTEERPETQGSDRDEETPEDQRGKAESPEERSGDEESPDDETDARSNEDPDAGNREQPDGPTPDLEDDSDAGGPEEPAAPSSPSDDSEHPSGDTEGPTDEEATERTPLVPGQARSEVSDVGEGAAPKLDAPETTDGSTPREGSGSRSEPGVDREGPRVRTRRATGTDSVDPAASVRAAAGRGGETVRSRDLRESVRAGRNATLVVFVVDASASMRPAMRTAKGTVLELLEDSYQQRDEVAFVAFAGESAEVLVPPTDSVTLAARHLKELPTGDRTPLPDGLATACEVLDRSDPAASTVVVVTDGRANAGEDPVADTRRTARELGRRDSHVLVVDAGSQDRGSLTDLLVENADAERVALRELSPERVETAARAAREN